jgi:hypothetical protein
MEVLERLATAHAKLAAATDQSDQSFCDSEIVDDLRARGWVDFPLSEPDLAKLEELAQFSFSPTLRGLFQTKGAMPSFSVDVFGVAEWAKESAIEKNRDLAGAREQYEWELPKFVAITSDEDFLAVTEDGRVVRVCSNEGNIEVDHGHLDGWLSRYAAAVLAKADGEEGGYEEDPEAEYI